MSSNAPDCSDRSKAVRPASADTCVFERARSTPTFRLVACCAAHNQTWRASSTHGLCVEEEAELVVGPFPGAEGFFETPERVRARSALSLGGLGGPAAHSPRRVGGALGEAALDEEVGEAEVVRAELCGL